MREKRDDTPDSPENFTLPYQKCLCNACKIWLKQKFCLRAREAFFGFILVGFAQVSMTLMKLKGGQQRRLQSGSAVLRLQAKRPGAQMAFMTIMGWRHIQWKSNLSSYRKKKKKVYECGFAPNTRQSESTMGTGRLPKSLLEQVPAARAGSPLPLGH